MPNRLSNILYIPDTHVPYHDKKAWELVLKVGRAFKPEIINVGGDLFDMFAVSSHSKDPERKLKLEWEIDEGKKALDDLDSLGAKIKKFQGGNHEDRLRRYLQDKAPELFNSISIPNIFNLEERGWEYTAYKESTKIGNVWFTHDVGVANKYAVYRAAETFQHSNVTAHTHRMCYVVDGDATGKSMVSASFGWLGDTDQVDYMNKVKAKRNWALGFGIGYLDNETGNVYLVPVPIIDYTCVIEGKFYSL